jgi:hypothetical protein
MSTLQISAPLTVQTTADARRPGPVLRVLRAVVDAVAETNRRRAAREIARVAHRYGIEADRVWDPVRTETRIQEITMIIVSFLRLFRSILSEARQMQREAARRHPHLDW